MDELQKSFGQHRFWITKPVASARGIGVSVIRTWKQVPKNRSVIVSRYIDRPLLIYGRKCDIRLYVLVSSVQPLKIYIYEEGLLRFASTEYSRSKKNIKKKFMHLTNYSINKTNADYQANTNADEDNTGHKWSFTAFIKYLKDQHINTEPVIQSIHDVVIKSIMCGYHQMHSLSKTYTGKK
jgi:tubulin polyglutamylase TTLL4